MITNSQTWGNVEGGGGSSFMQKIPVMFNNEHKLILQRETAEYKLKLLICAFFQVLIN